ncbi:MAG: J domain-containing protein [Alphaproteobacteria bacterium]|nr:J domain-containing protein [Alphaproteobacteria bacterium]
MRRNKTAKAQKTTRPCDFPGCGAGGACRAPKDRSLRHFYWFCPQHAAEYNKSWDFLKGLSPDEIERHLQHDAVWQRPTWKFGEGPTKGRPDVRGDSTIFADLGMDGADTLPRPAAVSETKLVRALDVMGLNMPVTLVQVKRQFKLLVKQYHPDTGGAQAAHRFHRLMDAYRYVSDRLNK